LSEREYQTESRALAFHTLDANVASMGIDHVLDDLGSESCSAGLSTERVSRKEAVTNFWRHATPCISHIKVEHVGGLRDLSDNGDGSAGGNFWNGIVHQVVEGVE